jgi:luciferase family oxidoreductase group 1
MATIPLSLLDVAPIRPGQTAGESLAGTVALAQLAEELGYRRVWYAEHHNFASLASATPSVLIAHVAAHTKRIRLGAGGVMLPNHAPLSVAEQFGLLETLHPGRIDLGLGRAPGTDQNTMLALRQDPAASERFPADVLELQGYLTGKSQIPGVTATPGDGTNIPLYVLGSSMFGASLAAALGLPFAFASHFSPGSLREAVALYRSEFRPSEQLDLPHVIAGVNVVIADTEHEADQHLTAHKRFMAVRMLARGRSLTDEEADALIDSPAGRQFLQMLTYSAVGTPADVRDYLEGFAKHADADELIVALQSPTSDTRLHAARLLAEAMPQG